MGADCVFGSDFPLLQRMNKKERRMMITEVMKMVLCMKLCVCDGVGLYAACTQK